MTIEITQFVTGSTGQTPLTSPANLPQIQIRRIDTQAIVQAFTNMTEIGDGNSSYFFTPVSTLDYTYQIDADPTVSGQALPRYFGGSFSGRADARILTDIPAFLVDTDVTIPGLIATFNDISVADILTAVFGGSGETVDVTLSRLDNIDHHHDPGHLRAQRHQRGGHPDRGSGLGRFRRPGRNLLEMRRPPTSQTAACTKRESR